MQCHCGRAANHKGACWTAKEYAAVKAARNQQPLKANDVMNLSTNKHAIENNTPQLGSHYDGPWTEVEALVAASSDWKEGFKPGIREVTVDPKGFYAGVVKLDEDSVLKAAFAPREGGGEGEESVTSVRASIAADGKYPGSGGKLPASGVVVFIYTREVLGEQATTDADWEIVSVQAVAGTEQVMDPVTMARNHLGLAGGTKGEFSNDDFAKAIIHWTQHAVVG